MTEHLLTRLDEMLATAKQAGAEAADAMMIESRDVSSSCRLQQLEAIERSEQSGIGLRVMIGKKQSCASTSDLSPAGLMELAERAVAMARQSPDDPYIAQAQIGEYCTDISDLDLYEGAEPEASALNEMALAVEAAALDVSGVTNSNGADAGYSDASVALATSQGFRASYRKSHHSISISVLAGEGTAMQRDYDYSIARFAEDLASPEQVGRLAAERAVAKLAPRKAKTTKVPVMFDARTARSLISQFASSINGTAISRGTSFLKEKREQAIFPEHVTISDDPLLRRGHGSRPYDAEGIAGRRKDIIANGVLTSWLLDLSTAKQLEMETTGNAARGLSSTPSPSSTNLVLKAGDKSPQALMQEMDTGLLVTEAFGMGVNLITGDYSQGAGGFWVENGEIAYPVAEVTIAGQLQDMFASLIPANDVDANGAVVVPSVMVGQMMVAGS